MRETMLPFALSQGRNGSTEKVPAGAFSRRRMMRLVNDAAKRLFDVVAALSSLIVLLPLFVMVAIVVKRDSPGPVFYRGRRAARGGRVFHILKFRTMYERPESYCGASVTAHDDPRITPLGRWLRDHKLNELPQVWNVLVGDMSLVGPRPEDPEIAATWPEAVRGEILSVRPGITSPASVIYRHEEELLSADDVMSSYLHSVMPSKLRLDQLYVRHRSLWLDLDVLLWTLLVVVVPGLGSYEPPEATLFWGPLSRLIGRHLSWFTIDLLITVAAFAVAGLSWRSFRVIDAGWLPATAGALLFSLLFSAAGALLGVNRISWSRALAADVFDLVPAVGLATLAALIINAQFGLFPMGLILLAAGLAFAGFVAARYRSRLLTGLAWRLARLRSGPRAARERVLIVGGGESGQLAAWLLRSQHRTEALQVVGFVDDDLYKRGVRIRGINVLGSRGNIPEVVRRYDVGIILFAIHNIPPAEREDLLAICHDSGARVVLLPNFLETLKAIVTPAVSPAYREPSAPR